MAKKKMFRSKAVDQLTSPEQLEQLLQVTNRRTWITLSTLVAAVVGILAWSVLGQIPVTVDGVGILTYPRQVVSFQAPAQGQVVSLNVTVGDSVTRGQVIGTINQPDIEQQLRQERIRLEETRNRNATAADLSERRRKLEQQAMARERELLQARIDSITEMTTAQKERNDRYIEEQLANIDEVMKTQAVIEYALQDRYGTYKQLRSEGLSSDDVVLEARQRLIEHQVRSSDLQLRIQEVELKRIESEATFQQRMDEVDELRVQQQELAVRAAQLEQQDLETEVERQVQIENIERNIARLEDDLRVRGRIVSEHTGEILELTAAPGQVVSAGQRLGSLDVEDAEAVLIGVAYFRVGDGKKIDEDVPLRITPATVERERYGSIEATVTNVSPFAVTTDAVASVVGNEDVARELLQRTTKIQVYADLELDPDSHTGFKWTSGRGPDSTISAGTTTTVRATIEYRRPITFVIPLLRRWSGI